jgi:hypothetical protein
MVNSVMNGAGALTGIGAAGSGLKAEPVWSVFGELG